MSKGLKKIHDLLQLSHNLSEVIEKETEALKDMKLEKVETLLEKKKQLSEAYEKEYFLFQEEHKENIDTLSKLDPELLHQLKKTSVRFQKACLDNKRTINANLEAQKKVWDTIVEVATSNNAELNNYSDKAQSVGNKNKANQAFLINKEL